MKMSSFNIKLAKSISGIFILVSLLFFSQCNNPASLNALIISDTAPEVSAMFKSMLSNTGLFNVTTQKGKRFDFSKYDVIVLNLEEATLPETALAELETYVKGGGGLVALGASSSVFNNWPAAPSVFGLQQASVPGKSKNHYDFLIVQSQTEHPVTNGLQTKWMHSDDYMVYNTDNVSDKFEVLATARADTAQGGNGKMLPVMWAGVVGEGRVFNAALGYASLIDQLQSIQCVGFITTLQRGAEWAATGVVSQEAPVDFPNSVSTHLWPKFKAPTLEEILEKASNYETGKSKQHLTDFSMRIRNSDGSAESYALYEQKIIEFLNSNATVDSKKYMCRELSWMGSDQSVDVLEKLLNDKDLAESASFALQRLKM